MRIRKISGLQNSIITCRQTPQGAVLRSGSPSGAATMAMAVNRRAPSLTALKKAVRSAQFVGV